MMLVETLKALSKVGKMIVGKAGTGSHSHQAEPAARGELGVKNLKLKWVCLKIGYPLKSRWILIISW